MRTVFFKVDRWWQTFFFKIAMINHTVSSSSSSSSPYTDMVYPYFCWMLWSLRHNSVIIWNPTTWKSRCSPQIGSEIKELTSFSPMEFPNKKSIENGRGGQSGWMICFRSHNIGWKNQRDVFSLNYFSQIECWASNDCWLRLESLGFCFI